MRSLTVKMRQIKNRAHHLHASDYPNKLLSISLTESPRKEANDFTNGGHD